MKQIPIWILSTTLVLLITACDNKGGPETSVKSDLFQDEDANDSEQQNASESPNTSTSDEGGAKSIGGAEPYTELWFRAKEKKLVDKIDALRAERTEENVRIRGTILHAAGQDVTLDKLGGEERFASISTTIINEEGVFELNAKTNQPQMFQLRFDGDKSIPLFLEGGTYELTADFDKWQDFQINSPQSYLLKDYFAILELHNERVKDLMDHQNSIQDGDHLEAFLRDSVQVRTFEVQDRTG